MSADTTGIGALRNRLDPHFGQPVMCFEAITVILLRISARTRSVPPWRCAKTASYRYRVLPDTTGGVSSCGWFPWSVFRVRHHAFPQPRTLF